MSFCSSALPEGLGVLCCKKNLPPISGQYRSVIATHGRFIPPENMTFGSAGVSGTAQSNTGTTVKQALGGNIAVLDTHQLFVRRKP